MRVVTVYIDILLFVNLIINGVVLYTVDRICGMEMTFLRFAAADAIASLYGLTICIPELAFGLNVLMKTGMAVIICLVAFGAKKILGLLKNTCVFLSVSFTYLACIVLFTLCTSSNCIYMRNNEVYFDLPVPYILLFTLLISVMFIIMRGIQKKRIPNSLIYSCTISVDGKTESLDCFMDTGNFLSEAITGTPVVIVEEDVACKLLPDISCVSPDDMTDKTRSRFRIIPYSGAGNSRGLLPAFRPDSFTVNGVEKKVIIAVNSRAFDKECRYKGILNGELIYGGLK